MNKLLNQSRIDYVLFHLKQHFKWESQLDELIQIGCTDTTNGPVIQFPLSGEPLNEIKYIDQIPVLFPINENRDWYYFDVNKNLIFNDDLLKSAFYLLSGYQETQPFKGDENGRFMYSDSIQKQLNIAYIPLVNVYFDIIGKGIEEFCSVHNFSFSKQTLLDHKNGTFILTHDVDRVDKYTTDLLKLNIKRIFQTNSDNIGLHQKLKDAIESFRKLFTKDNPYWNFEWMKKLERKYNIHSTWFFLPQGRLHRDAYYTFNEDRIQKLFRFLEAEGDEIALHGTFDSVDSIQIMRENMNTLQDALGYKPVGNRQHWLNMHYPDTLRILEELGFEYDSSWAFADHIGWRNSYCWPFKPYDLEYERMMDIWEIPITAMDVSLFEYQNLSYEEANRILLELTNQAKKHNGVFTLLWHNSYFDENQIPGIQSFYRALLNLYINKGMISMTAGTFVKSLKQNRN